MTLARILGSPGQVLDDQGAPLAGGLVNIYEPNTNTRITSYKDSALTQENVNPVVLSGGGRADIWVNRNCDINITDADGERTILEILSANPDDLGGSFDSGLVPNGSFKTDTDSDDVPDGWTEEVTSSGSNNGLDTTESTSGGQSLRTTSTGSGGGEFRTTDFFPVNDADDLRVDFDLRSTVANVRNIVRVEWYDVSQVSISNTDVYDSTANPLTFTSQNKLATPPANARFAKLRIIGGTTGGLGAGSTYWDRFRVYYPDPLSGSFDNITISGNDVTATNTNGNVNVTPDGTGRAQITQLSVLENAQNAVQSRHPVGVANVITALAVREFDGPLRDIAVMAPLLLNASDDLDQGYGKRMAYMTGSDAVTLTIDDPNDIPNGAWGVILCRNSNGLTIAGTAVRRQYAGSGSGTSTVSALNYGGWCFWWKQEDSTYNFIGQGLS